MKAEKTSIADALHKAHVALMKDVEGLEKALGGDQPAAAGDLVRKLTTLRTHVLQHFRFEEQDGYMDAVSSRMPHKGKVVKELLDEHKAMADDLDGLIESARSARAVDASFGGRLRAWIAAMRKHETRENLLVEDAFCQDVGNKD